mmetsp:Transcript_24061/g.56896  ORF Transcript_24061/g.56896 Transcript_24061/m.56896 type:complete len:407 (+) Transcript_24061:108-1328(+)
MQMGAGVTCEVDFFSSFMCLDGKRRLNTKNACAWKDGPTSCVWYQNGVWKMSPQKEDGKPTLLKPYHFSMNPRTGAKIDFLPEYGIPFWLKASKAIRDHIPDAIIFAEPILDMTDPSKKEEPKLTDEQVGPGYVWAPHYYDGMALMTKSYSRYMGMVSVNQRISFGMSWIDGSWIERSYAKGIDASKTAARRMGTGGCPVLIGECGVPFDMGGTSMSPLFFGFRKARTAFETGDFSTCTNALNRTMRALEIAQVSHTIWCYQPDNTNRYGDGWNGEDLSLFSKDQVDPGDEDDVLAGGRSLLAAIRPYPHRVAGDVVRYGFQLYRIRRPFELIFDADHNLQTNETVIFLPRYQYPHGVNVYIKQGDGGRYTIDWASQTLTYTHTKASSRNHLVVEKILDPNLSWFE